MHQDLSCSSSVASAGLRALGAQGLPACTGPSPATHATSEHPTPSLRPALDAIVPVAPKDYPQVRACAEGLLLHSRTPVRRVHIVSESEAALAGLPAGCPVTWIDEARYPFTKEDVRSLLAQKGTLHQHGTWYYQQLLKLYVHEVIPDLLPDALILDADYAFTGDVRFLTDDGRALLAPGYPFVWMLDTRDYPAHVTHGHAAFARRLVPGWEPQDCFSGMQHHMVFQRDILKDLFRRVEHAHGKDFWTAFLEHVDVAKWNAASEYVLYYHHALGRHADRVTRRHLPACDVIHDAKDDQGILSAVTRLRERASFVAVGCHAFHDLRERLRTMDYIPPDLRETMLAARSPAFKLVLEEGILRVEEFAGADERRAATRSPRGQAPRAADLSQARALASQGDAHGALAVCAAILQADKADVEAFRMYRELYLATQGVDLSHAEIFDFIYTANVWLYGSGAGSLPETTEPYRVFLQDFIRANGVRSVVDAGCGDWQFSRLIDWSGADYLGIDVSAVVLGNTRRHAAPGVRFLEGDARTLALPDADLLIMKDVMQHWSNADILAFLPQLRHFRHCLVVNGFPPERMHDLNGDSVTGGCRPVDLSAPPFHLVGTYVFTFVADEEKRVFLITRRRTLGCGA